MKFVFNLSIFDLVHLKFVITKPYFFNPARSVSPTSGNEFKIQTRHPRSPVCKVEKSPIDGIVPESIVPEVISLSTEKSLVK